LINFASKIMGKKFKIEGLTIENAASEGKCVGRYEGMVVFVENVAPGDVVDVLVKKKKKSFFEGAPIKFHSYSKDRVEPFCIHNDLCGGCKWQHLSYNKQLELKQQQVKDNLERIGKIDTSCMQPILGVENNKYYRNKLEFTFANKRWLTKEEINSGTDFDRRGLGFHLPGQFDKVLDIQECHLQHPLSNAIRNKFKAFALSKTFSFYDISEHKGFLRNLIIRNSNLDEWMAILQVAYGTKEEIDECMSFLANEFPEITSAYYIVNTKKNETFYDIDPVLFYGKEYIREEMDGLIFKIGPKSFFQTNSKQALLLYRKAIEMAGLKGGENIYDLYTGTGTIANFVARKAKQVVGIESVKEAIDDAIFNSEQNGINNTIFYTGDMKDLLNERLFEKHGKPDVVITDPPRAGMHENVVKAILNAAPEKIVYVSCNPATQARDLALLKEKYKVTGIQAVDMFPHTHHVENIVSLELNA